MRIRRNKK